ncbi:MAG: type II secretion system secretin GspD [Bdellovibrionales bacterium]|nr:type II secretion system secretin GspD [Bdellovibrionales bacterium]
MRQKIIVVVLYSFCLQLSFASSPQGKKTEVSFDEALPEDISNENFPDKIESFNFPQANLLDLVKAISKFTGMNFILDPSLNNKQISIIALSPITVAEAYKAFLSALAINNYSVVRSGAFWKIQSTDKIHKDNIEVYSGDYFPSTDQLITRIIKLKHINAKEFETSIKWLLSQENKIFTHEASNSLIISDYGTVIERIMKIVYEMDVPGVEEEIKVIQLEYTSAEDLANILRDLLSLDSSSVKKKSSSSISSRRGRSNVVLSPQFRSGKNKQVKTKISAIIPDMRTNSLIVKADMEGFNRIQELVKKLDTRIDLSKTGGVWVYNVLYGTAEEVYNTLMGIKPAQRSTNQRNNRGFFVRSKQNRNVSTNSSQSPLFKDVNILADHNTNSLIISARSKYEYVRVLNVLKKIDVPRDQVFIQAIILEMRLGKGNNTEFNLAGTLTSLLGKSFGKEGSIFRTLGDSALAGFLSDSFNFASLQQSQLGPGLVLGLPLLKLLEDVLDVDQIAGSEEISSRYPEFDSLDTDQQENILKAAVRADKNNSLRQTLSTSFVPLVRLLRKSDNINILSTPQITTLDNVPAFIEVGENAPVGLSNISTVSGTSQSIDRQDVTLKLEITPLINPESRTVQMDIKQKFDDFSKKASSAPELNRQAVSVIKRNIETQLVLHDGETAVLGGLLSDKKIKNYNKVPLLGDIPFIGWLFQGSDTQIEKTNLLVFITPTIISGTKQKEKGKEILEKKLEERISFIEEYMGGRDPHAVILGDLIPIYTDIKERYIETEEVEDLSFEQELADEIKNRRESEEKEIKKQENLRFQEKDMTESDKKESTENSDFEYTLEAISGPELDSFQQELPEGESEFVPEGESEFIPEGESEFVPEGEEFTDQEKVLENDFMDSEDYQEESF